MTDSCSEIILTSCCGQLLDIPPRELARRVKELEEDNDAKQARVKELEASLLKLIDAAAKNDGWASLLEDDIDDAIASVMGKQTD